MRRGIMKLFSKRAKTTKSITNVRNAAPNILTIEHLMKDYFGFLIPTR